MIKFKSPKGEKVWVVFHKMGGEIEYIITSKTNDTSMYYRYNLVNGELVKAGKNNNPLNLEN